MAFAGQVYETNPTLRSALEIAAYGAYIGDDAIRYELWMSRHDSEKKKAEIIEEFKSWRIRKHLKKMSHPLEEEYRNLYEAAIDYGAHPNERGFSISTSIIENDDQKSFEQIYLHGEGIQLDYALNNIFRVGVWVLYLFRIIYPHRYDLLGIGAELETLQKSR